MKNTIILLALLLVSLSLAFGQMREPEQVPLKYNSSIPIMLDSKSAPMPQNNGYSVGYHWGNNESISRAINANQNNVVAQYLYNENTQSYDSHFVQDSALIFRQGFYNDQYRVFTHALTDVARLNTHSMAFKANLLIDGDYNEDSIIARRPFDESHPIFGFQSINPLISISQNQSDPNYNFLVIPDTTLVDQELFSNPWGSEYLRKAPPKSPFVKIVIYFQKYQNFVRVVSPVYLLYQQVRIIKKN